ncbi:hypothetical protein OROHE_015078 [Orobanche hederae]
MEMIDQNNATVGSTTRSNYYVRILSTINASSSNPLLLSLCIAILTPFVDVLPPEANSSILLLSQSDKPDVTYNFLVKWLEGGVPQGSLCKSPEEKRPDVLSLILLICVTKVAKSASDQVLAEHEDIDDAVGSEEPTERDHGVDLQQLLPIKIDSSDNHKK